MEESYVVNPLDIIIIAVIIFGMVRGSKKGLFGMTKSILAVVSSVVLGLTFRAVAEDFYLNYTTVRLSEGGLALLSFSTAFVVCYIIIYAVLNLLQGVLGEDKKLNFSSAFGALFGGALATIGLSLVLYFLSFAGFPSEANKQESITYPFVKYVGRGVLGLVPKALREANRTIKKYGGDVLPPEDEVNSTQNTASDDISIEPEEEKKSDRPGPIRPVR